MELPNLLDWMQKLSANVRFADVLDVLIIAVVVHYLLVWIREHDAIGVAIAAIAAIAVYALARWTEMYLTLAMFQAGLVVIVVSLVIVFQQDVRHAIERLAAWRPFSKPHPTVSVQSVDTLVDSIRALAEESMGALIVLEANQPLDRHLRGGSRASAEISVPLIRSVFDKHSPGHDGAAIIRGNRLDSFGVHLPLSTNLREVGSGGTRHTAALGLSERSDALVIVVSEERGTISIAEGTSLRTISSDAELKQKLQAFTSETNKVPTSQRKTPPMRRVGRGMLALGIASALWLLFAFSVDTVFRTYSGVPVEFRNLPEEWRVEEVAPSEVDVTLSGPERAFGAIGADSLKAVFSGGPLQEGTFWLSIRSDQLELPTGVAVAAGQSPRVRVRMHRYRRRSLPIRVVTAESSSALNRLRVTVEPAQIEAWVRDGPDPIDAIATEPIALNNLQPPTTFDVNLAESNQVILDESTSTVKISVAAR